MAGVSHLDEIIDYKQKIINLLGYSQAVVGLLLDDPNIDMDGDDAYDVFNNNIFDYDYVDDTQREAKSYIMVEVDTYTTSPTIKDMFITVQIVVPKDKMKLSTKVFKGVKGNRKDNLARQIDLLLNNNRDFGIGRLELLRVVQADVPENYTSRLLSYKIPDFAKDRSLENV